jgi:formate--tetrahydrofolate ligase
MKTDIQIAQENVMEPIERIARKAKIDNEYLEHYGKYKAKIDLRIMESLTNQKDGKLILVTSINPTKAGEGKSTTTVGLADGLARLNKMVIGALREPSLGPVLALRVEQLVAVWHKSCQWRTSIFILMGICMR